MKPTMSIGSAGIIACTIIAGTCSGQTVNVHDDSLVIDSLHAAPVSRPVDTVTRQKTVISPVAADTMTRQTRTSTSVPVDTAVHQYKSSKPDTVEPAPIMDTEEASVEPEVRKLSPFSSDRVHYVGISFDYFSYAEVVHLSDIFPGYPDGYPPDFVQGAPKSTEYGLMFGFDYQGSLRKHGSPVLFRPDLEVQFGIHQTYDGSTQALPVYDTHGDTVGFQFLPTKIYKKNYFVQAGLDVGYCRTHDAIVPYYLYSGIKGKFWYRDMLADTTSYSNQITSSEMYYWFSAPLGLALSIPVSPDLALGLDMSCDLMFYGQMQMLLSSWDSEHTWKTVAPAVTLGDRAGLRVEFSITYKTANGNAYQFAPYFTMYSFGHSENEISKDYEDGAYIPGQDLIFSEPSSSTWLLGARFRMAFMSPYTHTR